MTNKNWNEYNFSESERKYSLFKSSRFTKEEQDFENELKEFLFTLSNKLNHVDRPIRPLKEEYYILHNKLYLLADKYIDKKTGESENEYYMLTRKLLPILESCNIILNYYEDTFYPCCDNK